MPILLVSLGTTWAVVPEAFHALPPGPHGFSAVHVLTTDSPTTDQPVAEVNAWFRARHPAVLLSITRVAGFADLRSEADHFRFEEVMYRWILELGGTPLSRHVCLAGGFKTMSAAMQQAAAVLGAAEVFHVLADPLYPTEKPGQLREARTAAEIDDSLARHAVRHLRLGPESGWPQLRTATGGLGDKKLGGPQRVVVPRERTHGSGLGLVNDEPQEIRCVEVPHERLSPRISAHQERLRLFGQRRPVLANCSVSLPVELGLRQRVLPLPGLPTGWSARQANDHRRSPRQSRQARSAKEQ
jgi:hypothetical protein